MSVKTGLDRLRDDKFGLLEGKRFGLVCNQATIASDGKHILDLMRPAVVFGPQHGLYGHTQDNMIEWEGSPDPVLGVPVHSLYGEHRKPRPEWLDGLDVLVIDLPDIGARYYTFAWTMALCLEACAEVGIPVVVLDRPNPLGGVVKEGPVQHPDYLSFVGLHPIEVRHGKTLGELAVWMKAAYYPGVEVEVVSAAGWERAMLFHETGLPWAMPSPNMPTCDTAYVYPGGCLLEGTNLSEGRGTTRPFEVVGAPWLNRRHFAAALNEKALPGVWFRATQFQPTFNKHSGDVCEGVFLHVHDPHTFRSVEAFTAILHVAWAQSEGRMEWKSPPYEYEYEKLPIDILWGSPELRRSVESEGALS